MTQADLKKFHIKSFGCQMNVYDGERMSELLLDQGMSAAENGEVADLVVLNTCHIREKAVDKVYSDIGRLRRKDGTGPMIAVAGCVAQAEGKEISRRAPSVDIVVGPQAYHRLPELIEVAKSGKKALDTDMPAASKFEVLPTRGKQARPTAFLTVQEGCDKFCTYCVVPYTRGAEISRPWSDLIDEAKALVDGGAREITLLGQNVNAWYGEDDKGQRQGLDGLIRALDKISGLQRIRYMTSHPNDMTEGLIAAHGDVTKLMPFLHLPVQSGSDRILKAMNRSHSAHSYLDILEKMRAVRPDIALSGDFIVGFPGESDQDFEETLQIVREANYSQAFSFKYSPRPGTPAAMMDEQVAPEVMDERLQRLQALLNEQQYAFNQQTVGRTTDILLERQGKLDGQLIGKTPWLQSVHIISPDLKIGDLVEIEVTQAGPNSLTGQIKERLAA
ncbi:MAG: tRNA (N6-isopentenyl adenosine(37)-C2)-methylthiotransferase MiaB [Sphingomonadales bacterium]|nr:tRNA (N6-isopentenyl adenosine(37)-C2)-methylthiotransferase MiaB [Sphingomonadales bacterium]NCO49173.1 tRNA (N6-isopentenyl adenosine(37)-C2)-methylthiotransferase MiaB [Sphingomonadales bacterium]NCP01446.1 tRNA (N6-isopentenyl adenosine(37)-C2)-methylthiotransferase MiaB [Sphingomonadales bacterium]NCP27973.1 tRNA (N6-isopentenyl adenosine(37)-C2)-methylthiotransferase MiaB [Sphingomonadales bacterium]NCP42629.1 tRNA (N6-isopentenyl adenosine(37)-C2)-methylthiotransferase MiaB [Sphingomo